MELCVCDARTKSPSALPYENWPRTWVLTRPLCGVAKTGWVIVKLFQKYPAVYGVGNYTSRMHSKYLCVCLRFHANLIDETTVEFHGEKFQTKTKLNHVDGRMDYVTIHLRLYLFITKSNGIFSFAISRNGWEFFEFLMLRRHGWVHTTWNAMHIECKYVCSFHVDPI